MTETSTVTFIGEVEVEHPGGLSNQAVVARAFETMAVEDIDVSDVMVTRHSDD